MGKILGLIGIFILGIGGYLGFNYYNDTYKTSTAYAITSSEIPVKVPTKDIDGKEVEDSYSYNYTVIFVTENGDKQKMEFEIAGKDPKPFEPGSYIKAEVSKKRVNAPTQITENEVPNNVKSEINKN
ncbi:DUF1093 domain-containing protein [Enterococcus mundtii]|uniref:DUF1093 domain-containing protein n=1 Tax=Enterococcus mundtii TaxID=53346 RepID=A0A242KUF7_ENTMU|nr:DUF1093 domain-containing protein [Enterococcus mundtii]OTP24876.1 hypothetical protein A5802_003031 [Enterococcus mundtii]